MNTSRPGAHADSGGESSRSSPRSDFDAEVGQLLTQARIAAGLSRSEVARRSGISALRLGRLERGQARLMIDEARVLAECYVTSITDFTPTVFVPKGSRARIGRASQGSWVQEPDGTPRRTERGGS